MSYKSGKIIISPKIIKWINPPKIVDNKVVLEFLKRDIFIKKINLKNESIAKIIEENEEADLIIYNFDKCISNPDNKNIDILKCCKKFINKIKKKENLKLLLHSNIVGEKIKLLFKENNISIIENNNMFNKQDVVKSIYKHVLSFIKIIKRSLRSHVRILFFPARLNKADIVNISHIDFVKTDAYLKDLSINGVGLILCESKKLDKFFIGDTVQLKLYLHNSVINIENAVIVRINQKESLLGINYQIRDNTMIRKRDANKITNIVYKWIKEYYNSKSS